MGKLGIFERFGTYVGEKIAATEWAQKAGKKVEANAVSQLPAGETAKAYARGILEPSEWTKFWHGNAALAKQTHVALVMTDRGLHLFPLTASGGVKQRIPVPESATMALEREERPVGALRVKLKINYLDPDKGELYLGILLGEPAAGALEPYIEEQREHSS